MQVLRVLLGCFDSIIQRKGLEARYLVAFAVFTTL